MFSCTRVCLAAWVNALLRYRKPILDLILDWRCLMWVWKESLQSIQTPGYLYLSTYSKSEQSRVVMLGGRAGAGSDRLNSMHLVLLAFKSSWRPRKESCRDLKLVWRLVKTQCPKRGQKYTEWCNLSRGGSENNQQQGQHHWCIQRRESAHELKPVTPT